MPDTNQIPGKEIPAFIKEAAEKVLIKYSHRIPDSPEFMDWQSLKQKQ